jgi:acetyl esterase/lipase
MKYLRSLQAVLSYMPILALIGSTQFISAQTSDADTQKEQRIQMWLDDQDKNQDGKVSPDEAIRQMKSNFKNLDRNNDGFIDRTELGQLADRLAGNRNRTEGNRTEAPSQNNRQQNQASRSASDSVQLIENIPYADTDNPRQMLDLLLPKNHEGESLPVIVFIHGGGWRNGNKQGGRNRVTPFVASGNYAGVTVAYRLSGETQWPSQIHDCKAAIRWIRANAKKYNLNADRIGVWGTSAGGHLVTMLGTSGDVKAMDGSLGSNNEYSSRVTCVADFFGPTNFLTMNKTAIESARLDHDAADSPESLLIGGAIQDNPEKVATADPITYVSADDPPILIVHGTKDPLVSFNQSELLYAALDKKGVDKTLITVDGGEHGRGFPPITGELVERFFDHHLRGNKTSWSDQTVQAVAIQRGR